MKPLLQLLMLTLITACASLQPTSDLALDQKFKACTDETYNQLASQSLPKDSLLYQKAHIHNVLENKLIANGYLEDLSKEGYSKLLDKSIAPKFFTEFENEIGLDPYFLFPQNAFASCYDVMDDKLHLFDEKSWQSKFVSVYKQFEAQGNGGIKSPYLKAALEEIPELKFQNITYRKLFLDLIYRYYNH
jgi:hypothetical protein